VPNAFQKNAQIAYLRPIQSQWLVLTSNGRRLKTKLTKMPRVFFFPHFGGMSGIRIASHR